ncbi:MAG: phage holin family protein [Candidatus Sabulitectum sp.]|nr:phage holin family protein [Candidatus Sabulitectum sp.]
MSKKNTAGILPNFIIAALVLFLTSLILGDRMVFSGFWGIIITAGVIGLLNFFIAPVIALLTCPLQILTLGLARFLVSGLMIILASHFLDSFAVASYWWAVLAAVVISILTSAVENLFGVRNRQN